MKEFLNNLNNGVQWSTCYLDNDNDIELNEAIRVLSKSEHERAAKFHFERDRNRFIRGRGFLRFVIGKQLRIAPELLKLELKEFGKPYIANSTIQFNLSHSSELSVIALSKNQPIGIDIEFIDLNVNFLELGNRVFNQYELEQFKLTTEKQHGKLFYKFWTAKEAYLKMLGMGLSLDPRDVRLIINCGQPYFCESDQYPDSKLTYLTLPSEDYICCIAELKNP